METPFGVWLQQVTILRSRKLSDAQEAVEAIRQRHCVLLQLDDAAPEEAQRIIDFLSGAVSALVVRWSASGSAPFCLLQLA